MQTQNRYYCCWFLNFKVSCKPKCHQSDWHLYPMQGQFNSCSMFHHVQYHVVQTTAGNKNVRTYFHVLNLIVEVKSFPSFLKSPKMHLTPSRGTLSKLLEKWLSSVVYRTCGNWQIHKSQHNIHYHKNKYGPTMVEMSTLSNFTFTPCTIQFGLYVLLV